MLEDSNLARDFDDPEAEFGFDRLQEGMDWEAPDRLNIAHECVDRHPPDDVALYYVGTDDPDRKITFRELTRGSNRFANGLESLGVERRDRVLSYMPRTPEHVEAMTATLKAGAVFSGVNERFGREGIAYRLDRADVTCVITTGKNLETVRAAVEQVSAVETVLVVNPSEETALREDEHAYETVVSPASPEYDVVETGAKDPSFLYFTSGTTGQPKGVLHAHRWIVSVGAMHRYLMDLREDDLYWSTADFGWLAGPITLYGSLFWGVSFLTYRGGFDAERWASILGEYPVTVFYSIPTAFRMLRENESVLKDAALSVRHSLSVGEPLDASTVEWSEDAFGAQIHELYGSTETGGSPICNLPLYPVRPGSMGRPFLDTEVTILDPETREEVETGDVGEIAVERSFPSLFEEYWDDPESTEAAFHDGWHLTGDLAQRDEDGYYWFRGRADDIILSAGYRIGPFEVESSLNGHPAVAESAVVPKPDGTRGNIVKAYVVLSGSMVTGEGSMLAEELKAHVRQNLSAHEHPREIEFVEDLPRTITGKIRRTELKEREKQTD
jgi:acetyl-CoA synthetase